MSEGTRQNETENLQSISSIISVEQDQDQHLEHLSQLQLLQELPKPKKRACDRCHEIKQVCTGSVPCERCARMSIKCVLDRPLKKIGRPQRGDRDSSYSPRSNSLIPSSDRRNGKLEKRTGIRHSKSACEACRKRKRKCDESWPNCGYCTKSNLECSGPTVRKRKPKAKSSRLDPLLQRKAEISLSIQSASSSTSLISSLSVDDSSASPHFDNPNDGNCSETTVSSQTSSTEQKSSEPIRDRCVKETHNIPVSPAAFMSTDTFLNNDITLLNMDKKTNTGAESSPMNSTCSSNDALFSDLFRRDNDDGDDNITSSIIDQDLRNFGLILANNSNNPESSEANINNESINNSSDNITRKRMAISRSDTPGPIQLHKSTSIKYHQLFENMNQISNSICLSLLNNIVMENNISVKERFLLKYFVTDVSFTIFADETSNAFMSTIIPISLKDKRVRDPILAIASAHRAGNDIKFFRDAVLYRSSSHATLLGSTSQVEYYFSDEILLSILLSGIMEILNGSSLGWSVLLEKASEITKFRGGIKKMASARSGYAPMLVQLFCYIDLISSLSTCHPPYIEQSAQNDNCQTSESTISEKIEIESHVYDQEEVTEILNSKFGFRFGIAGEIFKILGNISTLASLRKSRHDGEDQERQFQIMADDIEMKLQDWELPTTMNFNDVSDVQMSQYAMALQWAAFLRLHQIKDGYNRQDIRVKVCLSTILRAVKLIPEKSNLESSLMFPLILAGSVAITKTDRDFIISRVRSIKKRLKFHYIEEFERMLLYIWSRDNKEGNFVNWAAVRYYQFPGLVMF
ncbi:Fungal transcriptional regulatory protein [Scheffersomyces stipitis CBS 6054]|uniref:Fungal transcriptional regulatory protein n=1 Tax=Scheffersomyces stipitis (strain ATCC 58785 / CBS 6054 / NBRC 10063 / NRRL Y-11545) TaxID=322104 RepID=A3LSF1_PICST|nr:Fungal transcriptional regulatory protein [Scheffersomyces stipitis CBS 6054]ABN65893.2 Fungal transcriptional regulatory protein [Scheffersomyces stipitis CBS 6054]